MNDEEANTLETTYPLDVCKVMYLPGKDLVALSIVIKPEALDIPGVLAEVLTRIARAGIPVLRISTSRPMPGKPISALIALDASGRHEDINRIVSEIKSIAYVARVRVIRPLIKGLLVDTQLFPLLVCGERGILIRRSVYEAMFKTIRQRCGVGGAALLYHMGVLVGKSAYESYCRIADSRDPGLLIELAKAFVVACGMARVGDTSVDISSRRARLVALDLFECELHRGLGRPASQFFRGILAGFFSKLFNTEEIEVREVECIAAGHERCVFEIAAGST